MRLLAIVATCFMIPMLVLMFFIKFVNLEEIDKEMAVDETRSGDADIQQEVPDHDSGKAGGSRN